jgi:hypothetical protein
MLASLLIMLQLVRSKALGALSKKKLKYGIHCIAIEMMVEESQGSQV